MKELSFQFIGNFFLLEKAIKNISPKILVILTVILSYFLGAIAFAEGEYFDQSWNPKTPLVYGSSFHSLLWNQNQHIINQMALSTSCVNAIRQHLSSGDNFYSKTLLSYTLPLEYFPDEETKDRAYFHYTNSTDAFNNTRKGEVESNFRFLRTLNQMHSWYIYVASDENSSTQFGNMKIKFTFKPGVRIFLIREGYYGHDDQYTNIHVAIENDLISQDPNLAACRNLGYGKDVRSPSILLRLAAEGTGVGGIAYIGIKNRYPGQICVQCQGVQWLQLVGPWALESVSTNQN